MSWTAKDSKRSADLLRRIARAASRAADELEYAGTVREERAAARENHPSTTADARSVIMALLGQVDAIGERVCLEEIAAQDLEALDQRRRMLKL